MTLELGLETPAPSDKPFSVTQLMTSLQRLVASKTPVMWLEGEVSGFSQARSGHWYFTLKDRYSCVSCMVWADDVRKRRIVAPDEGTSVYAEGRLDVYTDKGQLRFVAKQVLPTSREGLHAARLEAARKALEKDGLLDPARKRDIPVMPSCIGVVTSADGAAWHDIVAVVRRRWPSCELVLVPTRVQGSEAPRNIVRALELANRLARLDVLIVGRGGGSTEDLQAFNDESVARAVAGSRVPTISAVGHEIDITLTDLVADRRAPTPSAAAEQAVPDRLELLGGLDRLQAHLAQAAGGRIQDARHRIENAAHRMDSRVSGRIRDTRHRLEAGRQRMDASCDRRFTACRARVQTLGAALDALSPLKVLDRGYAVARDDAGHVLKRMADLPPKKDFRLRVTDGEVRATVQP